MHKTDDGFLCLDKGDDTNVLCAYCREGGKMMNTCALCVMGKAEREKLATDRLLCTEHF